MAEVLETGTQVVMTETQRQYETFVQEVAAVMDADLQAFARAGKLADALARVTAIKGVQDPCWDAFARKVCSQEGTPVDYREEREECVIYLMEWEGDRCDSVLYGSVMSVYDVMLALVPLHARTWKSWAKKA